jgi:uncharacterized protein (DUF362 family)
MDVRGKIEERLARPRSYRVILRRCESVEPERVQSIVAESLGELGLKPAGKVLIKPNVVTANREYIQHSYTDPRIVAEVVKWASSAGAAKITVGESGGYGIPSRLFLSEAGYFDLKRLGADVLDFNTEPSSKIPLLRGEHHKSLLVARSLREADCLIWMPKLKYHICCTITCALKLNVGILTHKERMLFHDDRLDEKIVDLLEVGYPDAVVTDAVQIGTGFESAPHPVHLGVIMVADDPVAMDIAACRVLGYEPSECRHLMLAIKRGFGPKNIDDVQIEGDVSLDELRAKTHGHVSEYQDIQKVKTPIKFYSGNAPDRDRFCHGGCLAAVKGCLGTIDKRRPGSVARAKVGAIVTGVYHGDVDAGDGTALLVGACTKVNGKIRAKKIRRVGGCTVGTKQLLVAIPWHFGLPSPMSDVKDALKFIYFSIDKFVRRLLSWVKP